MNAEKLAYWFFRLNGCFTFENFIVHPDDRGAQRTDADIIALRFLHRQELRTSDRPMEDHPLFQGQEKYASVLFVEVKKGECSLNGPWRNPEKKNLQRVLNAMGLVHEVDIEAACTAMYGDFKFSQDNMAMSFAMVGRRSSSTRDWSNIPQLTWDEILRWMHSRYVAYADQKASNTQWDSAGQQLYRLAARQYLDDEDGYVNYWLREARIAEGS